jgi:trigger factor
MLDFAPQDAIWYDTPSMKKTLKQLSETKVSLTITLGSKDLADAEMVALAKLAKKVKAPGFRTGKVPPSVAVKYVDAQSLAEQTIDDALSKAVSQAFVDEKIPALDRPQVDIKKYVPGQELEFVAEAEVLPKIELGNYKKLAIKKVVGKVNDKDVENVIERMRRGFAKKTEVKRPAQHGDEVDIDFVGKRDGVAFEGGSSKNYTIELGSNQFIPGFEEGIVGHKVDETFDIPLRFPADYHAKTLAGADVVFSVTIHSIKELNLPDKNDDFAQQAGPFKTYDELKNDIESQLKQAKDREASEEFKDKLIDKLISVSRVPVPDVLLRDQMKSIEQDMSQNLMYQGLSLEMYLDNKSMTKDQWIESEVKQSAAKRVQAGLVLSELSKVEKITASDQELSLKINQYQEQYGNRSGQDFTSPEMQRDIANRLLTEKTLDRLVDLNLQ